MVESEFSLFQVQAKRVFGYVVKRCQASLCIAPERLNAVDMSFSIRKLILTMVHPEVLVKSDVHKSIVATPPIRMDDRAGLHMAADNALQRGFGAVRHNLGIDLPMSLQQPEYDRLAISTTAALAPYTVRTEVRFIDFYSAL